MYVTMYCKWTSFNKVQHYAFKCTGTLPDVLDACREAVLGSKSDFTVYAVDNHAE
jgi:hypothetical protein